LTSQLTEANPLVQLARQFGEATGKGQALRSALGTKPNSDDIKKFVEPHRRGSILVAAVFDAFFTIYQKRTADLWRIYRAGGGRDNPTDIPQPLANRLCEEATTLAEQFFRICVRALDYSAPVDITFGDYLRAIITADFDLRPRDEIGVRDALMQSFRLRGIYPDGAGYFSEGAIAWPRVTPADGLPVVTGLEFGDANGLTSEQKNKVGATLRAYAKANWQKLGFVSDDIQMPSFHPLFRVNQDGSLRTDMVVEMVQTRMELFDEKTPSLGSFPLRGGTTLMIQKPTAGEAGAVKNEAHIRYAISKKLGGKEGEQRLAKQRGTAASLGILEGDGDERFHINFSMLHEGL
ncbi:MAG TPA: peptidase M4, partial [Thermoanaerobaculia bacterium]